MAEPWDPWADILADPDGRSAGGGARRPDFPAIGAVPGITVRHRASGFSGVLVRFGKDMVELRAGNGVERVFRATPGALEVHGRPVTLVAVPLHTTARAVVTSSGSLAVAGTPARVARASRILVEGIHDAALVERVWGDDLRVEGVVVERLDGIDHLADVVRAFSPRADHRLGVLVDHLVPGSKEARLAAAVSHPHVLVAGTPFVDIWQAVKPAVAGIDSWPQVPRGMEWKLGVCRHLGVADPGEMWRCLLASVRTYADLEPELVGAVERLIDFVTEPACSEPCT